jgi:hypothetical protein
MALILLSPLQWCLYAVILSFLYIASFLFYNLFLHPLRRFPGPLSNRSSVLRKLYFLSKGRLIYHIQDLHKQYGPVVRIAPNELSFTDPQAWEDIFIRQPPGIAKTSHSHALAPDMAFYNPFNDLPPSIISSDDVSTRWVAY